MDLVSSSEDEPEELDAQEDVAEPSDGKPPKSPKLGSFPTFKGCTCVVIAGRQAAEDVGKDEVCDEKSSVGNAGAGQLTVQAPSKEVEILVRKNTFEFYTWKVPFTAITATQIDPHGFFIVFKVEYDDGVEEELKANRVPPLFNRKILHDKPLITAVLVAKEKSELADFVALVKADLNIKPIEDEAEVEGYVNSIPPKYLGQRTKLIKQQKAATPRLVLRLASSPVAHCSLAVCLLHAHRSPLIHLLRVIIRLCLAFDTPFPSAAPIFLPAARPGQAVRRGWPRVTSPCSSTEDRTRTRRRSRTRSPSPKAIWRGWTRANSSMITSSTST
jgi:hypothetical protein